MGPTYRLWNRRIGVFLESMSGKGRVLLRPINAIKAFTIGNTFELVFSILIIGMFVSFGGIIWNEEKQEDPASAESIIEARKESYCMNTYLPQIAAGRSDVLLNKDILRARKECAKAIAEFEIKQAQQKALQ